MTDVITFDVELTENQKIAQHKLYQVHKLYDEIEKLLGTQDVFNKPHMLLVLPNKLKKEPMTNEEYLRSANVNDMATMIATKLLELARHEYGMCDVVDRKIVLEWLKQPHQLTTK